ncbi:MAG: PDZ domain-containing protein, partial [Candidatus Rokuibacteriota bacterium]
AAVFGVLADGRLGGDGVRIAGVMPGSAAARAGLAEGDVIVRFAGVSVLSFDDLRGAVRGRRPGERVSVVFLRNGTARTGSGTLDAAP